MKFIRLFVFGMLLTSVFVAVGCNTFKGFGRDVEKGGETIQNTAEDAKPNK
ncbi:MAG: entericidin A/B family lipoprotein [FCB group bacterium]|jgi:predicted small secreted protein|nr:entericidin A/B family lipoprotein [FCB group bacterium]